MRVLVFFILTLYYYFTAKKILINRSCFVFVLDVSRIASYEITLVRRLSVCPSVTKFSQDWIIVFFLILYMMIADHDI